MNSTRTDNLAHLADRLRDLSGIIAMIVGLLLLFVWFKASMNAYVGMIVPRDAHARTSLVESVAFSIAE